MRLHDAEASVQTATNDLKAKERQENDVKSAKEAAQLNLTTLNNRLAELKNVSKSSLAVFHENMPRVVDEINRRRNSFKNMPIGPMGSFVKIKKEQWSGICENLFGRPLNGFLVTNFQDLETLRSILNAKQWYLPDFDLTDESDVPIFVSARDLFDYSAGEPDPQFDTVLRILDVSPFSYFADGRSRMRTLSVNLLCKITLNPLSSSSHVKKPIELCTVVVLPKSQLAMLSTPKHANKLVLPVATKSEERMFLFFSPSNMPVVVGVGFLLSGHGRAQLD